MGTVSIEEIGQINKGPKSFQLYIHKDRGLTDNLLERCKKAGFTSLCLTVDTVVAGNRERDRRTGFTTPPKLTLNSLDKRVVKIETQLEERWKEAILRIKRIEKIIFGTAGAIILMLVSILTRM